MSDIEFYESWCEYNKNNLPISFAEYCYQRGRADERETIDDVRADAIDECIALARAEIDFESQVEQKRFVEFMKQLKEKNE